MALFAAFWTPPRTRDKSLKEFGRRSMPSDDPDDDDVPALQSFEKEHHRRRQTPRSPEEAEVVKLRAEVAALRSEDLDLDRQKRKLRREASPQRRLLMLVEETVNMVPELMGAFKKREQRMAARHRANTPPPVSTSCCDCFEIDLTSPTRTCKWCGCDKSQHTCESSATGSATAIADVGRMDSMEVTPDREAVAAATAAQKAAAATATQRAAAATAAQKASTKPSSARCPPGRRPQARPLAGELDTPATAKTPQRARPAAPPRLLLAASCL